MRKFNFRLEQVLKQREAHAEMAALEKARAQEDYNLKLYRLDEAKQQYDRVVQNEAVGHPMDLFNMLAYCDHMNGVIKKRELALNKSSRKLERCQDKLVLAMQERTVLEKLKEKQYSEYQLYTARLEQKQLDDIAIGRHVRAQLQLT